MTNSSSGTPAILRTAVLFLAFNRPGPTERVFDRIRQAKPEKLYIALDGPREGNLADIAKVNEVAQIASATTWPCAVKTLVRDRNLGCRKAVSSAIDWFFEQETEGIILEDDCLPHPDFFIFCEQLLARYRNDPRIWAITGNNFQNGAKRGEASYYFSRYPHIWGWATWRRCWSHYDEGMQSWPSWRRSRHFHHTFRDVEERRFWERAFAKVYSGEIDTWDYQWVATVWRNNGLTATPQTNLVSNIGFGDDATHTKKYNKNRDVPCIPLGGPGLKHPNHILADEDADRYVFGHQFVSSRPGTVRPSSFRERLQLILSKLMNKH